MTTLVICINKDCMFAEKREDDLYQCSCTTIGINWNKECDSYMIHPKNLNRFLKKGNKK